MSRTLATFLTAAILTASLAAPAAAQLRVTKSADLAAPVKLEPGQGAILVAFRRPDEMSAGKSGAMSFARYDVEGRDLILQPRDAKQNGDKTTYWVDVKSADKKLAVEYHLMPVSEGNYVLFGASPGPGKQVLNTFCLGAPTFRVNAGEVVYFGDITPYVMVEVTGDVINSASPAAISPATMLLGPIIARQTAGRANAMAYSSHEDDARKALASRPELAAAFRKADLRNEATYSCVGQEMLAYAVPGASALETAAAGKAD